MDLDRKSFSHSGIRKQPAICTGKLTGCIARGSRFPWGWSLPLRNKWKRQFCTHEPGEKSEEPPRHVLGLVSAPVSHRSWGGGRGTDLRLGSLCPNPSPASCWGWWDTGCPEQITTTAAKASGLCRPPLPPGATGHSAARVPGKQPSARARRKKPTSDRQVEAARVRCPPASPASRWSISSAAAPRHPACFSLLR